MAFSAVSLPRLSQRVWLQVVSAFIPGLILLVEACLAASPDILTRLGNLELSGLASTFWLLLGSSVSYVIGVLNRALTFRIAPHLRREKDQRTPAEVLEVAREQFGPSATSTALAGASMLVGDTGLREGYFTYCKFWLRRYAPNTSVDSHELDINARFALSTPVAFSLVVLVRVVISRREETATATVVLLTVGAVVIGLALAYMLLRRGIDGQCHERQDALDFYIATWLVHSNPPPNLAPPTGRSDEIASAESEK